MGRCDSPLIFNKEKKAENPRDVPLIYPKNLTPLPHQIDAVKWALAEKNTYIRADPGLGKTVEAALIWNALPGWSAFYVCPPYLVQNTKAEFEKWCFGKIPHLIPDSLLAKKEIQELFLAETRKSKNKRILFIDEAHRFKNLTALRTKNLFGVFLKNCDRVVFLSGTPLPNGRAREIWPIVRSAAPEIFGTNFFHFGTKYCAPFKGPFGWSFDGCTNRKEFKARLTRKFMLIQKKELLNLPPKREGLLVVGDEETPKEIDEFEAEIKKSRSYPDIVKGDVLDFHNIKNPEVHLATYLRLLGGYKLKYVIPFLEDFLETTDEKIIIFAIHRAVVIGLGRKLAKYSPFVVTGDVRKEQRQQFVNEFQKNPKRRVFIGNIQACGTGFTLTKATRVVFVEFSWVDGENQQASDRAHRIGQTESVLSQYVVLKNSIDHARMQKLMLKRNLAV